MKNKKIIALALATSFVLTSCFNKNNEKIQDKKEKKASVKTEQKIKEDNTTEVLVDSEIKKDDIVKVVKHGDHWHIFTKDGKEHISYKDPKDFGKDGGVDLVDVVDTNKLKNKNVIAIKKHGDHWHVYTKDGGEYLTYENPSGLFPNIKIGTYTGNHRTNPTSQAKNKTNNSQKLSGDKVVKILQHGDHWHIYTANGNEYISYSNPSASYPHIKIGIYTVNHSNQNTKTNKKLANSNNNVKNNRKSKENNKVDNSSNKEKQRLEKIKNLKLIPILGKGTINRYDIVKILVHNDHYHVYDSKNREAITYTNPKDLFPKAYFGEYGNKNHTENKKPEKNNPEVKPPKDKKDENKDEKWPKGITKIIDHKDHWHLYRGDEEVGVVKENPRHIYPDAEYIVEKNESDDIAISDDEIFEYKDIRAELIKGVIPYLEGDLSKFTHFGNLPENEAVYGSNGVRENIFYWHHQNHYHAKTIKQIIQMQKNKKFGPYTAKDVVKTIKYKIENPNTNLEYKSKIKIEDIKEFLKNHYKVDSADILNIGDSMVQVFIQDQTLNFYTRDFEMKNGKITYKKDLPKVSIKKETIEEENKEENETKEITENKKIENIEKNENSKKENNNNDKSNAPENKKEKDQTNTKQAKEINPTEEIKKENPTSSENNH